MSMDYRAAGVSQIVLVPYLHEFAVFSADWDQPIVLWGVSTIINIVWMGLNFLC